MASLLVRLSHHFLATQKRIIIVAKKYNKEALLADHKTGAYTQRDLAKRYSISAGMVNRVVQGIQKENEQIVEKKIDVEHELKSFSKQEVNAVNEVVNKELKKREEAEKIDSYLNSAIGIAAKASVMLLQKEGVSMNEILQFSNAQNNLRVGLGTQEKFSKTTINNTNAQQNNELGVVFERI